MLGLCIALVASPDQRAYNGVCGYQKLAGMLAGYRQLLKAGEVTS
jgi:hypothetical protein